MLGLDMIKLEGGSKDMVGTRRLELLISTVSTRLSAVTHYTLTALTPIRSRLKHSLGNLIGPTVNIVTGNASMGNDTLRFLVDIHSVLLEFGGYARLRSAG
jgi:hypothetical protein